MKKPKVNFSANLIIITLQKVTIGMILKTVSVTEWMTLMIP